MHTDPPAWIEWLCDHRGWALVAGGGIGAVCAWASTWVPWLMPALLVLIGVHTLVEWASTPRRRPCMICQNQHAMMLPRTDAPPRPWWAPMSARDYVWICPEHMGTYFRLQWRSRHVA